MYQKEVFRIDYPTGHMDLNVGMFFGTATQKSIKKVLSLCSRFCPDARRDELIFKLKEERNQYTWVLNHLDAIEAERLAALEEIGAGYDAREQTPVEHGIQMRITKIDAIIHDLVNVEEREKWKG